MDIKKANNSFTLGVVMDPIQAIAPAKDTTLGMLLAAQEMGGALYYMEQDDLYIQEGKTYGVARSLDVFDDNKAWFSLGEAEHIALGDLDIILMRKDPPVDKRFIHTTYILEQAEREGAYVTNRPHTLRDHNEKLLAQEFPTFCPPHLVAADFTALSDFFKKHNKIIIKPLDAMGGRGVFLVDKDDVNFRVIWEELTQNGSYPIIAQPFIPEISRGDKRVIVFDGEPFEYALVRLPQQGSVRGNLAAGGSYDVRPLNEKEGDIAETVGKVLAKKGIMFAGLDIIGDKLIEVNITSPTGLRELTKESGQNASKLLMEKIIAAAGH